MYLLIFGAVLLVGIGLLIKHFQAGQCHSKARLDGKITIITGANTGIGKENAKDFALRGATVIMACRDLTRGEKAAQDVRSETGITDKIFVRQLDLGSLKSIKKFAREFSNEFPKLDILVNNAGVMMCPYTLTEDGFEQQFGVNHLGHFALTNLLLPKMKEAGKGGRIVNLSSIGHNLFARFDLDDLHWKKEKYSDTYAYGQSKLCNVLFTKSLHRRLADEGITAYAVHPGAVATDLMRHYPTMEKIFWILYPVFFRFFYKSPEEGAQTSIYCAVQEGIENLSGEYFADCARLPSHKWTYEVDKQKQLWKVSEELTGIKYPF